RRTAGDFVARNGIGSDDIRNAVEVFAHKYRISRARRFANAHNAAVGDGTAQKCDLALARQHHVGNEIAATVQVALVFLARYASADALRRHALPSALLCRHVVAVAVQAVLGQPEPAVGFVEELAPRGVNLLEVLALGGKLVIGLERSLVAGI